MRIKEFIMKANNIGRINQAVTVLRHFIDLSARLLPFLDEINHKSKPSISELCDREAIIEIYEQYDFDSDTSTMLMDSPILSLIKNTFDKLVDKKNADQELRAFNSELKRLQKNWMVIDAN
jgi:cell fate (sporulation/competence/biofilm development) regulator YlbF (YheA/YmcA/DUF963 family)